MIRQRKHVFLSFSFSFFYFIFINEIIEITASVSILFLTPCTISFQTFFVWARLLIVHTWNSSPLRYNLLRLQCTCCTVPTTSGRLHGSPRAWACQWPSSQSFSSPQLSHNDSLWALGTSRSHREQGLDYRECDKLSWCPSWSNSQWQGWSCGLVHCPGGNATDPIWRVLASSDRISSWTALKYQYSNPNPNPLANQLWCIYFLTPPTPLIIPQRLPTFLESLMPLKNWCSIHVKWSKSSLKHSIRFCGFFSKFKTILLHIVLLKCQIAFLKITSCDNQGLIGCIPIATVAVDLKLKS